MFAILLFGCPGPDVTPTPPTVFVAGVSRVPETCDPIVVDEPTGEDPTSEDECSEHADCPGGRCVQEPVDGVLICVTDECDADDQCASDEACACDQFVAGVRQHRCVAATCREQADCDADFACMTSANCGDTYHCQTDNDSCVSDADCPPPTNSDDEFAESRCLYRPGQGRWGCDVVSACTD